MNVFVCITCGTEFARSEAPPTACPICLDERQYVAFDGQQWTTIDELAVAHRNRVEEVEPGLWGIGTQPEFAIGQRALLSGGVLWDCLTLLDDATASAIEQVGGLHTIAISHPHYYAGMVTWAERFDARILLHEADRQHVMRSSARIEHWSGERLELDPDHELIRLGGHFDGATVCLWRPGAEGRGALLAGDVATVVSDRDWVSFMYSYPNLIPLPAHEIRRIRSVLEGLDFDRIYGAWWPRVIDHDGKVKALRSADRYIAALER